MSAPTGRIAAFASIGAAAVAAVSAASLGLAPPAWSATGTATVQRIQFHGDVIHDVEFIACIGQTADVFQTMYGSLVITTVGSLTQLTGTVRGPASFTVRDSTASPPSFTGWTEIHIGNHGQLDASGEPAGRAQLQVASLVRGTLSDGRPLAFEEIGQLRTDTAGAVTLAFDRVVCRTPSA